MIWNEREMPAWMRAVVPRRVMSRPAKWMVPAFGCSSPVSMLKNVVFPAPFGPMKLCNW